VEIVIVMVAVEACDNGFRCGGGGGCCGGDSL
jgi:hypothetical protein